MKHPTATLEGANLDYAVALAWCLVQDGYFEDSIHITNGKCYIGDDLFAPSTDGSQGITIIDHEKIGLVYWRAKLFLEPGWQANIEMPGVTSILSPTSLIAAMRCFVASKLGEEVEIP